MAITGINQEQWSSFIQEGGELIAEIDPEDISNDRSFEQVPSIAKKLKTGFEIPPSPIVYNTEIGDMIELLGEPWVHISAAVYRRGGSISYRLLPNGRYEAKMTIPRKA